MNLKKDLIIPLIAFFIILTGTASSIYTYTTQSNLEIDTNIILISDKEFDMDWIFSNVLSRTFESLNSSGIALDDLIIKSGVDNPSFHSYIFIGSDGYSRNVEWENLKNGLLDDKKRVVFFDLPKAFNVRDIIEIEVI
jgi:hypothetical protein